VPGNGSSNVGVSSSNSLGPLLEGTSNFSIASQSRLHNVISIVRMGHSNHVILKKCQEKRGHWYVLSANASKISLLDLRHVALSKHGLHMYFNLQSQCNLIIYKRKCFPWQKFIFHKIISHQFPPSLFSSVLQLTCSKVSATFHASETFYNWAQNLCEHCYEYQVINNTKKYQLYITNILFSPSLAEEL
jgi:hypothetical protein